MFILSGFAASGAFASISGVTINEIRIDQPGSDLDEYFELAGLAGESLDGLYYLVIGDGSAAAGSGVVEAVIDLSGNAIDGDGYWFAAENGGAFGFTANLDLGASGLNFENSDNVTHMLVSGFSGVLGDDLDLDDDGVLDVNPWAAVIDMVAMVEDDPNGPPDGSEWWYGSTIVGPDGDFVPAHIARFPNGGGAWQIGNFDPFAGPNPSFDTPGFANVIIPTPGVLALLGLAGLAGRGRRRR